MPRYVDDDLLIEKLEYLTSRVPEDQLEMRRFILDKIDMLRRFSRGKQVSSRYLSRSQ